MNRKILSLLLAGLLALTSLTAFVACEEETNQIEDADDDDDGKKEEIGDKKSKLPSELFASVLKADALTVTSHVKSGSFTTDYVMKYDGKLLYRKKTTDLFVPGMNENEEYYIEVATGTKYSCKDGVWTKEEGEPVAIETLLDELMGITRSLKYVDVQYGDYDSETGRYNITQEMIKSLVGSEELIEAANYIAYMVETANGFEQIIKHEDYGDTAKTDSKLVVTFECEKMTLPEV